MAATDAAPLLSARRWSTPPQPAREVTPATLVDVVARRKPKEAFVHRSALPGTTMEVDFGETWGDVAGATCKVNYRVARCIAS